MKLGKCSNSKMGNHEQNDQCEAVVKSTKIVYSFTYMTIVFYSVTQF